MKTFAFVFPGQGSQAVGMMRSFSENVAVREVFAEASAVLGQDLWALQAEGPPEALNATVNTQPIMLTAGYATYKAWRAAGGAEPKIVAGHSLGEYTALVVAGALSFAEALPLVRFRAEAMQQAVPLGTGAMAAVLGLDDEGVIAACREASSNGEVVEAVNFNAPSQVVIAGHKAAVERAGEAARARGAKRAVALPVSAPFHSSLLQPAARQLAERMQEVCFSSPTIPLINNVDVATVTTSSEIKDSLARQAASPVRWVEVVRAMAAEGVTDVVECGPGKVLAGLTRRIAPSVQGHALSDAMAIPIVLEALK